MIELLGEVVEMSINVDWIFQEFWEMGIDRYIVCKAMNGIGLLFKTFPKTRQKMKTKVEMSSGSFSIFNAL